MNEYVLSRKESKMKEFLKDESGFTLVELLAAVVILAIISAISVVAIGRVIQNTREDAGISNVQQAMNAAELYHSTEAKPGAESGNTVYTLDEIIKGGYLNIASGTFSATDQVTFTVQKDGNLEMHVPAGTLKAGSKQNQEFTGDSNKVLGLTRETFWNKSSKE